MNLADNFGQVKADLPASFKTFLRKVAQRECDVTSGL
jgi:hypothetical protein